MRIIARNRAKRRVAPSLSILSWACLILSSTAAAASPYAKAGPTKRPLTPGQLEAAVSILSSHMDVLRGRGPYDVAPGLTRFAGDDDFALFPYVKEYTEDPNPRVVRRAHSIMFTILENSTDPSERQTIVGEMMDDVADPNKHTDKGQILPRLVDIARASDFTDRSKEILRELVSAHPRRDRVLLVGVAGIESELPRLQVIIDDLEGELKKQHHDLRPRREQLIDQLPEELKRRCRRPSRGQTTYWQGSLLWAALRARARMGVKEDIQRCIDMVESHPEPSYQVGWLLRELSYVRQPEVVSYISKYLHTDRMLPSGGDATVAGSYAQGAARALAFMLEDFPKEPDRSIGRQDITVLRKWMAEQTEWKIIR